jgi:hypothetical protein
MLSHDKRSEYDQEVSGYSKPYIVVSSQHGLSPWVFFAQPY